MSGKRSDRIELPVMDAAVSETPGCGTDTTPQEYTRMNRRTAIKVIAAAAASPAVFTGCDPGQGTRAASGDASARGALSNPLAAGTSTDPDLVAPIIPWDLTLEEDELLTLAAICDVIIPADERSPAASAVGAQDFIDEWVSAPYDGMRRDRVLVQGGIVWLDGESQRRFSARFRDLTRDQKHAICDDISYEETAAPRFRSAARFFDKIRGLTATAFYTTQEGMDDIGYVGNVPLAQWDLPPAAALRHVGLE
jgi:Gluconate 2-dehydrogenase subunit 3